MSPHYKEGNSSVPNLNFALSSFFFFHLGLVFWGLCFPQRPFGSLVSAEQRRNDPVRASALPRVP
uniref:Phospholipid-transporting ATPase 2 n=1 Tax=Rhizophora mucronata TaxID=61149 RepID=A0A2P2LF89_RHIMU